MLQNFCISNLYIFTDDGAICSAPKRQKLMTVFDCPLEMDVLNHLPAIGHWKTICCWVIVTIHKT